MRLFIDALKSQVYAIKSGHTPTLFSCNQLIHLYSKHGFLQQACNLFDEMPERNVFTWNAIISAHIKSNNLPKAQLLFDSAPCKDSVTYNSMLSGYANSEGHDTQAFDLFTQMHFTGYEYDVQIDEFTLTTMCNLTAKIRNSRYGKQLHSFMVKTGNNLSGFAVSALVDMYSKSGCFNEAYEAFHGCNFESVDVVSKNAVVAACCREGRLDMAMEIFSNQLELNDVVSWNTMITGYTQNGYHKDAIELSSLMMKNGFQWNEHTFASVLSACSSTKSLKLGKEVHGRIVKNRMNSNPFIISRIIDLYCKCGYMKYAESIHSRNKIENMFSTTSMIVGYSSQHDMIKARKLFDSLKSKNTVVWSAMFSGYLNSHDSSDVFKLFQFFNIQEKTIPNCSILATLLGACALQAIIDPGKQIHGYLIRTIVEIDYKTISALIDMYSKCGNIKYAEIIFKTSKFRDLVMYNIMILGFAHHGYEDKAFELFDNMVELGFQPDNVTFIAILSVCRHCGLVKTGEDYFKLMTEVYKIEPEIDHYSCMIDLYGRCNEVERAMEFMRKIPVELDAVVVGSFLSGCRVHRKGELAREVEEELLRIGGKSGTRYVQLANVYAAEGRWEEVGRLRKKMRGKEIGKVAGCSWVHVGGKVHSFISGDTCHLEMEGVYGILGLLVMEMTETEKVLYEFF
ncbi:unnamed protein product [Lactuca saligna]|uniref:Pentatricopeptide repeat-containing protein n=1 Tax=Lactuca saligna TaxID=75948 RepID=A0AA35ZM38_LACSI|nr:unnamed protein product [Lactuca saligna]